MINFGISQKRSRGFTVVELLVVIVVIGILASIGIVSYGNYKKSVAIAQLKSDLNGVATAMENARTFGNAYPASVPSTFTPSQGVTLTGGSYDSGKTYCIDAASSADTSLHYFVDSLTGSQGAQQGLCGTSHAIPGQVLVVAGGGGGTGGVNGVNYGSGGGGGTVIYNSAYAITVGTKTVTVGGISAVGVTGNNSVFDTITATGGTAVANSSKTGGANANYSGGTASAGTDSGGGAGGGANGSVSTAGSGYLSSISGSAVNYAGGGGAVVSNVGQAGGAGGGGAGASGGSGVNGTANTGGGGGGGALASSAGGSGVVIVSYPTGPITATGGAITYTDSNNLNPRPSTPYTGGHTIHTFTGSGTLTILPTGA